MDKLTGKPANTFDTSVYVDAYKKEPVGVGQWAFIFTGEYGVQRVKGERSYSDAQKAIQRRAWRKGFTGTIVVYA